jgi:hypothetical protein
MSPLHGTSPRIECDSLDSLGRGDHLEPFAFANTERHVISCIDIKHPALLRRSIIRRRLYVYISVGPQRSPEDANNLGVALQNMGRTKEANKEFRKEQQFDQARQPKKQSSNFRPSIDEVATETINSNPHGACCEKRLR